MESLTRGTLVWTGEHWINALRVPGAAEDSGKVSLYCAHHTPAGRGHVASVEIGADSGIGGLCTDNPELASFINETMWSNECALPVVEASFQSRTAGLRTPAISCPVPATETVGPR